MKNSHGLKKTYGSPFTKNLYTKMGKSFLSLLDLHFPKNHIHNSIFNRNKMRVSYSCMKKIKLIINNNNMKVLNNTAEIKESCNCIYDAQITSNQLNYEQKIQIGTTETDFKHRFNNHAKSFNLEHYEKQNGQV